MSVASQTIIRRLCASCRLLAVMSVQSTRLRLNIRHAKRRVSKMSVSPSVKDVRSENWCARTKRVEHATTEYKSTQNLLHLFIFRTQTPNSPERWLRRAMQDKVLARLPAGLLAYLLAGLLTCLLACLLVTAINKIVSCLQIAWPQLTTAEKRTVFGRRCKQSLSAILTLFWCHQASRKPSHRNTQSVAEDKAEPESHGPKRLTANFPAPAHLAATSLLTVA